MNDGFRFEISQNLSAELPYRAIEQASFEATFSGEISLDTYACLQEFSVPPTAEIKGGPLDGLELAFDDAMCRREIEERDANDSGERISLDELLDEFGR